MFGLCYFIEFYLTDKMILKLILLYLSFLAVLFYYSNFHFFFLLACDAVERIVVLLYSDMAV